tara:strand:- start:725 stop:928 length:204 start_codon:yes stop_codon:yes gene_type:complete
MILSLKYLFAAHNFVIIFLVLIVLLLAFDIERNNNKILLPVETLPKINILKETLKLHSIRRVDKKLN